MHAIFITKFGVVEDVVQYGELPVGEVLAHDVQIEVRAASVNPIDYLLAGGFNSVDANPAEPKILGCDVAGVVSDVGTSVTKFAIGDEVYARVDSSRPGTFAEFVSVDEKLVALKPQVLSFEEAASMPLVALTAWQALTEKAALHAGDQVLIHGGTGGVGSMAIQMAKNIGAEVTTTAGGAHAQLLRDLGASRVIDYKKENFEDVLSGLDVVFDTLGGTVQQRSFSVLKPGGVLVSILDTSQSQQLAESHDVRVESFFMRPDGNGLEMLSKLVDSGKVRPVVDRTFPLADTASALLCSRSGRAKGKIVIAVG